jgi:hypothetical protein
MVLAVSFNTVAAWVGIATGIAAVFYAGRSATVASQANRDEQDNRAYTDANLLVAVPTQHIAGPPGSATTSNLAIDVTNNGRWPVYDLVVRIYGHEPDVLGALAPEELEWRYDALGPGRTARWIIRLPVDNSIWSMAGARVSTTLDFTDDTGNRWAKSTEGILTQRSSGRRWLRPTRRRSLSTR